MKAKSHTPPEARHQKTARRSRPPATSGLAESKASVPPHRADSTARLQDPPLIRVLLREAQRRGHQPQQMACSLGCTYDYVQQLRTGVREARHIGQEFAENAASYLGVPPALVKLLAGRLSIRDFAWPQRSREEDIADSLAALRDDPIVGALVPDALDRAAPEVQEFCAALYMECAERHPPRVRALPRMLDYLQRAALNEADFEVEVAQLRDSLAVPQRRPNQQRS